MRRFRRCLIVDCTCNSVTCKLMRFPSRKTLAEIWLKFMRLSHPYPEMTKVSRNYFLCIHHFEDGCFSVSKRKYLACPTLFTEKEVKTRKPHKLIRRLLKALRGEVVDDHQSYTLKLHVDHNYCTKVDTVLPAIEDILKEYVPDTPENVLPSTTDGAACDSTIYNNIDDDHQSHQSPPHILSTDDLATSNTQQVWSEQPPSDGAAAYSFSPNQPGIDPTTSLEPYIIFRRTPAENVLPSTTDGAACDSTIYNNIDDDHQSQQSPPHIPSTDLSAPKKPRQRVRIIGKLENLPPESQRLYREYKKLVKRLKRRKATVKLTTEQMFEKLTKNMKPLAKKIMYIQTKMSKKLKKGRRFTLEEKLLALALYRGDPKSYTFLRKIFILPANTTLKKMAARMLNETGFNIQDFAMEINEASDVDDDDENDADENPTTEPPSELPSQFEFPDSNAQVLPTLPEFPDTSAQVLPLQFEFPDTSALVLPQANIRNIARRVQPRTKIRNTTARLLPRAKIRNKNARVLPQANAPDASSPVLPSSNLKYAAYGQYIAAKLSSMPNHMATYCQRIMNDAILMAETDTLNANIVNRFSAQVSSHYVSPWGADIRFLNEE